MKNVIQFSDENKNDKYVVHYFWTRDTARFNRWVPRIDL